MVISTFGWHGPPGAMADSDGRALLVNLHKKVVLHHFNFKQPVRDIKYSPNGRSVQWQVSPGGMVKGLLVAYKHWTTDRKVKGSSPTSSRDLFLFWVHSALPQKLRRIFFTSFEGTLSRQPREPLKISLSAIGDFLINWVIPGKTIIKLVANRCIITKTIYLQDIILYFLISSQLLG